MSYCIGSVMEIKSNGGEQNVMKIWGSREGFYKVRPYDYSSPEYAPLNGWHFYLVLILICDRPKRRRYLGRLLADINYFLPRPRRLLFSFRNVFFSFIIALPTHISF